MTKGWYLPAGLVFLAFIIRLNYAIYSHDFWMDEAVNFFISKNPAHIIIYALSHDNWPPLYSLLMHFWQRISDHLIWVRLPSVIFGSLTLVVIYQIAQRLFNKQTALLVLILSTVSPPLVYFSAENRPLALFVLLGTLTIYSYLHLAQKTTPKNLLLFIFFATLALYTHYFAALLILALPVSSFLSSYLEVKPKALLMAYLFILALFSPWLILIANTEKPGCLCLEPLLGIPSTLAFMMLGGGGFITLKRFFEPETPLFLKLTYGSFLLLATAIVACSFQFSKIAKIRWLLWVYSLPILMVLLISFFIPMFSIRSYIFLVPIFLLLTLYSLLNIGQDIKAKFYFVIYLIFQILVLLTTSQRPFFNQEPLYQMSQMLRDFDEQNSQIIHLNLYTYLPSKFYHPNLNQYVLKQDLPEPSYQALPVKFLQSLDYPKKTLLVYVKDRLEIEKLNNLQRSLLKKYLNYRQITLGRVILVIYE